MVSPDLENAILAFLAGTAMASFSADLARRFRPSLEDFQRTSEAGVAPPYRKRILCLVSLPPIAWCLAMSIYVHVVYTIGKMMVQSSKEYLHQNSDYTMLTVFLVFVCLMVVFDLTVTAFFLYRHRKALQGLRTIIRSTPQAPASIELESRLPIPRTSTRPNIGEDPWHTGVISHSDEHNLHRQMRNIEHHGSNTHQTIELVSQPQMKITTPIYSHCCANAYRIMERGRPTARACRSAARNNSGHNIFHNLPSTSPIPYHAVNRHSSSDSIGGPPSIVSHYGSNDSDIDATSISSGEPLTPTSLTTDYGHSAMWSRLPSTEHEAEQVARLHRTMLDRLKGAQPGRNTSDHLYDQRAQKAMARGQANSATLALNKGVSIPIGASAVTETDSPRSHSRPFLGTSSPRHAQPIITFSLDPTASAAANHLHSYSRRVLVDAQPVQFQKADGFSRIKRIASPRLRLEVPGRSSLVCKCTAE